MPHDGESSDAKTGPAGSPPVPGWGAVSERTCVATVLFADIVGYSKETTDRQLAWRTRFTSVLASTLRDVAETERIIVEAGDGAAVCFLGDPQRAMTCALAIIDALSAPERDEPRLHVRIGINTGPVKLTPGAKAETWVVGDAINVAARVMAFAGDDEVLVSRSYHETVACLEEGNAALFTSVGVRADKHGREHELYRLARLVEPGGAAGRIGRVRSRPKRSQGIVLALVVVLAASAGGLLVKLYVGRPDPATTTTVPQPSSVAPFADRPSIAVLPFDNMTGDPEQAYFADGFAEQLITALSKVPGLSVVSRNSSFTYKGKAVAVPQISRELGVRYVLEGSVKKVSNRVRINVQLIDGTSGHHVWAESYDRELKDIFALEDELILKILPPLQVGVGRPVGSATSQPSRTKNVDAYLKALQCSHALWKGTRESVAAGRRAAEEAIALDPEFPTSYFCLGQVHFFEAYYGASHPGEGIASAIALTEKALEMDRSLVGARARLGWLYEIAGRYDDGIAEAQKAVELSPAHSDVYYSLANVLKYASRLPEAIAANEQAMRLEPVPWDMYAVNLASLHFLAGDCGQALVTDANRSRRERDGLAAHVQTASTYAGCGKEREARLEAAEVLRINPKFTVAKWMALLPYKNPADKERFAAGLRMAGLPP